MSSKSKNNLTSVVLYRRLSKHYEKKMIILHFAKKWLEASFQTLGLKSPLLHSLKN